MTKLGEGEGQVTVKGKGTKGKTVERKGTRSRKKRKKQDGDSECSIFSDVQLSEEGTDNERASRKRQRNHKTLDALPAEEMDRDTGLRTSHQQIEI